jgi:hypothetical protein
MTRQSCIAGWSTRCILAIGILGSYNSPDLELVRRDLFDAARDGKVLEITNTGKSPLKVVSIKINDRTDCVIARLWFDDGSPLVPTVMKIRDRISLVSSCQIIRVSVETDQGSNTSSVIIDRCESEPGRAGRRAGSKTQQVCRASAQAMQVWDLYCR